MTSAVAPPRDWLRTAVPVPTRRAVLLATATTVIVAAAPVVITTTTATVVLLTLIVADAALAVAPRLLEVRRELARVVTMGGSATLTWTVTNSSRRRAHVELADELPPSLGAAERTAHLTVSASGQASTATSLAPTRRGTFRFDRVWLRSIGPLGLAARQSPRPAVSVLEVHPRFASRAQTELRIRRARILEQGQRALRARGASAEFDALRDYVEGDELRHVDWSATSRSGRPIVRTYRAERNQVVVVLLDLGRTTAATIDGVPRLDHHMDAVLAVATAATTLGDRVGLVAFDDDVRAVVPPGRRPSQPGAISTAMHRLEPRLTASDYLGALATVQTRFRQRAMVVVVTELAAEAVEGSLIAPLAGFARSHAVIVAGVRDPLLDRAMRAQVTDAGDAHRAAAAASTVAMRTSVATQLQRLGAVVVDRPPASLAAASVDAYLEIKARGGW